MSILAKVGASALQSVLTVSLIILLILSALMAASLHVSRIYHQKKRSEKLARNAMSAMNLLLAGTVDFQDSVTIDLYGNQRDSVILKKDTWGLYDVYQAIAFTVNDSVRKQALGGVAILPEEDYALYLADQHLPLSVSGETTIKGSVFIPEAGVRKSYIEGREFASKEVVSGDTKSSDTELPALNKEMLERLSLNFELDSASDFISIETMDDDFYNSFENETQVFFSNDSLNIENSISGNILIQCKSAVKISSHAQLENVQIYAKSILVEEGFQGSIQAFARDSIRLEEDVTLEYPAVLGLIPEENEQDEQEFNPVITVGKGSEVSGLVFTVWPEKEGVFPLIQLDSAFVYGQVFSAGMLQLKGKVEGTTITQGFILHTSSTLYENFVLDGVMDRDALSPYYLGSSLLNTNPVKKIMKWL